MTWARFVDAAGREVLVRENELAGYNPPGTEHGALASVYLRSGATLFVRCDTASAFEAIVSASSPLDPELPLRINHPDGSRTMFMGDTRVTLSWDGPISPADLEYAAGELGEP